MNIRIWLARAVGASMIALLSSCMTVGPDYHVPENAVVQSPMIERSFARFRRSGDLAGAAAR